MSVEWRLGPRETVEPFTRSDGEGIWELATRQHGVISRAQLVAAGRTRHEVATDLRRGRLRALHRGVYAVGHSALTMRGWWMAAVLACGEGAALSHRCAARHRGLIDRHPGRPAVSVPAARRAQHPGIAVHRINSVHPEIVDGIPCTPVARIIVDMAAISRRDQLERLVEEAVVRDLFNLRAVQATLAGIARPRGVRLLRSVLDGFHPGTTLTKSGLEDAMRALCDRAGMPRPLVNRGVRLLAGDVVEVDFHWPAQRVVVETDSNRYHATHPKRRRDRAKDRALQLAGWIVLRVPEEDLADRPDAILGDLGTALARRMNV